jgi:hypothetical protein
MASSSFSRCPTAVTPSSFRVSSECGLVFPEAQAPQPDHNVHTALKLPDCSIASPEQIDETVLPSLTHGPQGLWGRYGHHPAAGASSGTEGNRHRAVADVRRGPSFAPRLTGRSSASAALISMWTLRKPRRRRRTRR